MLLSYNCNIDDWLFALCYNLMVCRQAAFDGLRSLCSHLQAEVLLFLYRPSVYFSSRQSVATPFIC